jgi:hypothetical protein
MPALREDIQSTRQEGASGFEGGGEGVGIRAAALGEVGFAAAFAAHDGGDFFDDGAGVGFACGAAGDERTKDGFAFVAASHHDDAVEGFFEFPRQQGKKGGISLPEILHNDAQSLEALCLGG